MLDLHISFSRLPKDGSPVPKHAEFDTYYELYFIVFYCLYLLVNLLNVFIFIFKHNV